MNARLAPLCLLITVVPSACGGGGGGGGEPELPDNSPPAMSVPGGLGGTNPSYQYVLPAGSTQTLTFTASDPEGDPLLWQLGVPGALATACGLSFTTPVTGTTFTLEIESVGSPAAVPATLLVEDPRGAAAAIDLLIVRSGAPAITGVEPNSTFATLPQQVTITGNAFELGGIVTTIASFDGFAALPATVQVVDDTTLTCETPAAVATGATVVAVGHQFGNASLPDTDFTVFPFPPVFAPADQRLDLSNGVNGFQLAATGASVHAVWTQTLIGITTLQHRLSTDGGTTWSTPTTQLAEQTNESEPQIHADGDDVLVAYNINGTQVGCVRSEDGGASFAFTSPVISPSNPIPKRRPRLTGSGDRRYLAWLEGDSTVGAARVRVAVSNDRGANWSTPVPVSNVANQDNHEIHCAGNNVWVVMEDDRLGALARGIYVVHSGDGGANWGDAHRLNTAGSAGSQPRGCVAGSRAHVAWLQGGELLYLSSIDGGGTWGNNVTTVQDAAGGAVSAPSIACGPQRICFGYVLGGTAVWSARIPTPTSPVQRTQVETAATVSAETSVRLDGNYAYVTWIEGATSAARVHVAVSGDGTETFGSSAPFGNGTAQQQSPQLVAQGARLILGWLDSRDPSVGVFTNRVQ